MKQIQIKTMSKQELEQFLKDLEDTKFQVKNRNWSPVMNITKETFEENTSYTLQIIDTFEEEAKKLLKDKK